MRGLENTFHLDVSWQPKLNRQDKKNCALCTVTPISNLAYKFLNLIELTYMLFHRWHRVEKHPLVPLPQHCSKLPSHNIED